MSTQELHGRILCIHQGAVGDLILALPAVKTLRAALQPSWLEIMGHPWTLPLAMGRPYADAVTDINQGDMAPFFQEDAHLPAALKGYLGHFNTAFYFGGSATLAHNLRRAGIQKTFILPPFPAGRTPVTLHHLASLRALGIPVPPCTPKIYLRDEEKEWAEEFFCQRGWGLDEIIALHPGAGTRKKAWPPQRFAALGRQLARGPTKLLIIQGPADEGCVEEALTGLEGIPTLVARDLPLRKVAALLSCACLFIGNDSGCSHLAAALGVRTLALFGPTDPLIWAPRGEQASWLQGKVACAPCDRAQQRACERQRCLEAIEVPAVLACINERWMFHHQGALKDERPIARGTPGYQRTGNPEGRALPPP